MRRAAVCVLKHLGKNSPIGAYRSEMSEDVDELVQGGMDKDAAWLQVIDEKLANLNGEKVRIEQSVADAYAKTAAGKPAPQPKPAAAAEPAPVAESPAEPTPPPAQPEAEQGGAPERIEDVGEKIGGARKDGLKADEAGRKAVDEQIAKVQAMLEAPAEVVAHAPEPAAPAVEQPEAETDAIDQRIAEAELAGVELSDDDKDKIRAALTKAEELNRKAGRISGLASDPMRKGNAFPMGVGFTRMTKRAEQRIDASVKRAGEAVEVFKRAEQAERYAEALLAGNGTDADKIRKEEVRTETRRVLLDKLLNWKKGDKIGAYTIERVSNDAEGYPSSYTISGDGIIKGVSDKVQVAREFFDGDKEALRAMVDEIRGPTAAAPAEAEKPTPADKPASKTPLVDAHLELFKGVRAGTATPDDFKAMYRRFRDEKAAVVAELNTSTKDQLLQDISGYVRPGTTKGDLVEMIYNGMLSRFALGKDYGPRWMTMGEEKAYEKATRDALDALVEGQTAESLAEYAAAAKAEFDAEVAKRTALMESVKDPKTLQDFRNYMRLKTSEGMDYQEARLTLTPEQRATMDELAATETRSRRTSAKEEQRTQVRVAGQMVDGGIIATKHTKKGHDLYVVRLSERVSTEDYKTLLEGAKRIGGYYSSYRGGGAIPGFQFTERSQAEAFVKLAGGDNTAAQEAAKDRRNAYEDDRSQSAAERLVEMAEKMEEDADESLGRDRKANTERRARFAAAAEAGARNLQAMAKTMRNVAQALTAGKAKFLDRIRTRTQIELLQTYVANAKGDQLRAKYPTYAEQEKRRGEPPDVETADYAEFPSYTAYRSDLASLGRQLLEVDGTKKLGERLMKVADDVSDSFTAWAKEPGNLFRLSTFSVRSGEDVKTAIFKDRETAERAIKRSGLSGKAIVFPEKRGVNRVIMSPSEAIAKGIWTGDGDKRITLSDEFGAELVEGIGRVAKRQAKDRMNARAAATPWQFERAYERRKQLQRMGLETPAEFRSALREFISLREQAIEADRVKMLERAMVGKAKDGLDFFPTPESVADEMIAAADIKPDMAVLEPSAGMGHIADRIRAAGAEPDVIEMANDRRELLQEKGYHLQPYYDFLQMEPRKFFTYGDVFRAPDGKEGTLRGLGGMGSQRVRLEDEAGNAIGYYQRDEVEGVRLRGTQSGYDRIIMNPPFSNGRDIEHVRHAYTLLKPGGRIVAIMGESAFTNQNKKATEFREWLDSVGGTEEKLPAGTFNDPSLPVNTGANARMVVIDRSESDTPFSRASTGRGIPESDARNLASILRAALPKAPPIIIHDSVDKAPQSLRDAIYAEGAERDVEAAYHEGEIHVFPGHIESAERFNFVVGHHEMRHYGIRGILGQQYKQVLTGIAMRNPTLRAAARAKQDAGLAKDLATGVDEALADMPVEEIAALSGIDRLVSRIRQWLRETAAKLREYKLFALADAIDPKEWTDKDVAHFVWKVEDFARRGGSPMSTGGTMFSGPAQTDTEAFRKWFGDSKVVDENGEPLVVYHGTFSDFSKFSDRRLGENTDDNASSQAYAQTSRVGFWFNTKPMGSSSAGYTVDMPAYLSIQNPKTEMSLDWLAQGLESTKGRTYRRQLIADGYDGIVLQDEEFGGESWIAFRPEQIKSATGNRGTFDPADPDIRFSRAPGLNMSREALASQDLVNARGGVFDFNRLGETKQDRIRTVIDGARPFWLGALTRDQIADVFGDEIPPVRDYDQLTRSMENERQKMAQDADKLYNEWAKLPEAANDRLARIMLDATVNSVHPDKDAGLPKKATPEQRAVHARIRAEFKALPPEAQAMYGKVKAFHENTLAQLRQAIEARIDRQVENGAAKQATLTNIRKMFDKYMENGPYFPLSRFGDFLVIGTRGDGERVVAAYENAGEQQAAARALQADGFTVKMKTSKTYSRETDGSAGQFIGDVMLTLEKVDMVEATINGSRTDLKNQLLDDINQLFIKSLPDLSYRKHFTHRKNTPGFSADVMRGFAASAFHSASHIARVNHGDQMTFALRDAYSAIENAPEGDFNKHTQVLNELTKRHDAALNPNTHPIASMLNQVGFVMYLGLSPAAGLVNLLQTPMVTLPHLGARYGFRKASASMGKATSDIMAAPMNKQSGWDATASDKLTAAEKAAMRELQDEGIIDLTQAHDLASASGLDTGNVARSKAAFAMARAMKIVGWTFHVPEVMNRQVTALSAYRLEMERSNDDAKAKEAAREAIRRTHFDYSSSNRARYMQGNIARVVMQFKQYAQNMTYLLGRAAQQALSGETPEVRRIARRQLVATLAATFGMAGALGLPGLGAAMGLIGMMVGALDDDDEPWEWKVELRNLLADTAGKEFGEVISHGVPRALMPWDLAGRVGMGDLWWRDSGRESDNPREALGATAVSVLGPTAGTVLGWYTASDHMARGDYSKAAEAIVPKFIRDPLKAVRESQEGVTSYTGEPLKDVTAAEVIGRLFGFAPASVSEMYEGNNAVMTPKTVLEQKRSRLLSQVAKARIDKDAERERELREKIAEFNRRNPEFKITGASIVKSVMARRRNRANTEDGIMLPDTKDFLRERARFAVTQ